MFSIDNVTGEAFGPAPCHFVPSGEEVAHALIEHWSTPRNADRHVPWQK